MPPTVREAHPADVPAILECIRELAAFEREPDAVEADAAALMAALFPANGAAFVFALVVEVGGAVAGCAIWYLSFSTWTGRHGVYLEDLYVRPAHRRRGHARRMLARLAAICEERGLRRLEWAVLDWNSEAIAFYRSLGSVALDQWTTNRVSGLALRRLAGLDDEKPRP